MRTTDLFPDVPQAFGYDDFTFRLRMGQQVNGVPKSLDAFRVTTGDPLLAADIAEIYGGKPQEWETTTEEAIEVLTDAKRLEIIICSLDSEYAFWGLGGERPLRACNGESQKDEKSTACACKAMFPEKKLWKEAANQKAACKPSVKATFRLVDLPDAGLWRFQSSSWGLHDGDPHWLKEKMDAGRIWQPPVGHLQDELESHGGRAMGVIEIVGVTFKSKKDDKPFSFNKPQISITGPVPEVVDALLVPA